MSLLTIVQQTIEIAGFDTAPSTVIGNQSTIAIQVLANLKQVGKRLVRESHDWQFLIKEQDLTLDGTGSYELSTVFSDGDYVRIIPRTIWNNTTSQPATFIDSAEWQAVNNGSITTSTLSPYLRIRGNELLVDPDNTGEVLKLEYISDNWITDSTGVTKKSDFTADDDLVLYDENLLIDYLVFRIKRIKGLNSVVEFDEYERLKEAIMGQETPKRTLTMERSARVIPTYNLPTSNWGS